MCDTISSVLDKVDYHGIEVIEYKKHRRGTRSTARKFGTFQSQIQPFRTASRSVLFTGNGRSGTTFTANVFLKNNIDIRHEEVGLHGTSSWYFCTDANWYPYQPWRTKLYPRTKVSMKVHVGERKCQYTFENVFHLVRDPLATIASMHSVLLTLDQEWAEEFVLKESVNKKLLRIMMIWYRVNKQVEYEHPNAQIIRLPELETELPKIARTLDLPKVEIPNRIYKHSSSGFKKRAPFLWSELEQEDALLTKRIYEMGEMYGIV